MTQFPYYSLWMIFLDCFPDENIEAHTVEGTQLL